VWPLLRSRPLSTEPMSVRARHATARALVAAASLSLVLALIAGYARLVAVDSDQFANRAVAALRDDSVRTLVAEKITDEVVLKNRADLLAARPIIESVASGVVGSRAFTALFEGAVRDVHRALFHRDRDTVTLTVADVGTVLAAALQELRPSLAAEVESAGRVELLKRDIGGLSADLARVGDEIRLLAVFLLVATVLLAAGALAPPRIAAARSSSSGSGPPRAASSWPWPTPLCARWRLITSSSRRSGRPRAPSGTRSSGISGRRA
jgi:hypothetical protein